MAQAEFKLPAGERLFSAAPRISHAKIDHRKPGIIAKVCAQVSEYYVAALKKIEASNRENKLEPISESVGDKRSRAWIKYIDFKSVYYKAWTFLS